MFPQIQQPWEREAAYRKGYERGLAASEPSRKITVNVSGMPQHQISFVVRQDTTMETVLAEAQRRLPEIQHPFTITTVGANRQELALGMTSEVMEFLQPWDAAFLSLRLNIHDPTSKKEPKKTLGSRLKKAFGGGGDRSADAQGNQVPSASKVTDATSSQSSMRSAPPPYEQ